MNSQYDWEKYLEFAEQIGNDSAYDIDTRARIMVSRAYYAAFHLAKNFCEKMMINISATEATHVAVIKSLKKIPAYSKIGSQLEEFKQKRHKADYNSKWIFGMKALTTATQFVKRVRQFIEKLNSLTIL